MFSFLRKIRLRLTSQASSDTVRHSFIVSGAAWKYALYALGEIFLVVIGILIALYVNNINQDRINDEKIKATLQEIQRDITTDVRGSMYYTWRYILRDSLKNQLFNNKVTTDDIKSGRIKPYRAAFVYDPMIVRSNGYDKLILDIENVPKHYNELINGLNLQYKFRRSYLEGLTQRFIEDCFKNQTIRNHLDWYVQDEFTGTISDQQIDYYLNDQEFKELAIGMSYDAASLFGAITSYRVVAINSYFIIEDLLGKDALETPDIIMRTTLTDADQAKRLSGRYRLVTGPPNTDYGKEFEITSEGKQLYIKRDSAVAQLLYPWAPKKMEFFVEHGRSLIMFSSESSDKITIVHGTSDNTIWEKY